MPKSRSRARKPVHLRGLPSDLIRMAPSGWSPPRVRRWVVGCLAGVRGLARPEPSPSEKARLPRWNWAVLIAWEKEIASGWRYGRSLPVGRRAPYLLP
jgi:hypothetical protein